MWERHGVGENIAFRKYLEWQVHEDVGGIMTEQLKWTAGAREPSSHPRKESVPLPCAGTGPQIGETYCQY